MKRQAALWTGLAFATLLPATALAQGPNQGPAPYYQVVSRDPNAVELRFHGLPLRGVHADDSQNALSLDFNGAVDGSVFDRLPGDMPQWIGMAYANFDNGVIRATRPVTYLTRSEPDGFSLRIVARGGPQVAQNAPPPPPQMRGDAADEPPPPPMPFRNRDNYGSLKSYAAGELAVRRADPLWRQIYGRADMLADSGVGISGEGNAYHGGDQVIATHANAKYTFAPGIAFVGDVQVTDVIGTNTRLDNGNVVRHAATALVTGIGGLAFELGHDTEMKLEASEGNNLTGGRLSFYTGEPDGFIAFTGDYHTPYLDTPTAIANRADRDQATLAGAMQLSWMPWGTLWGSLAGHYIRYGVKDDADVGQTGGWDGSLRWTTDSLGHGLLAGLAYDGHGEYVFDFDHYAGGPPTPYVPLGLRNIENHAVTASLTTAMWNGLWFSAYGGYVTDRYSSDGLLAGLDLHYDPAPGVDLALGIRQSAVSYTQGETGRQSSAGLNLTMGFGAPPRPTWMLNSL